MSEAIRSMFNSIAGRYDSLNRTLSAGRDLAWRRRAAAKLPRLNSDARILDLCGGTGDFALALQRSGISSFCVIGDFSISMLRLSRGKTGLSAQPTAMDALNPPFQKGTFDSVVCGFGMRNLDNLEDGIRSVYDLLKPGGTFFTLEFFRPQTVFTRLFYRVFAPIFIPFLGRAMGSSREAYEYLVHSVQRFKSVQEYAVLCHAVGFEKVETFACDFGIAHGVLAVKGKD